VQNDDKTKEKHMEKRPAYNPLYWLAALGPGGLAVSFFVYANFMVPHKGIPMLTFDKAYPVFMQGGPMAWLIGAVYVLFLIATFYHLKLLFWNIKEFAAYKKTEAYEVMRTSNNEVQLFAIPLTLAMTINVLFILGALFVPHLWDYVEYMFPAAIVAFTITGYYVSKIFLEYFGRILAHGEFDLVENNSLAQMLSIFAYVMTGVGFSASAAMSTTLWVEVYGNIGAIFFSAVAILLILIKLVLGFNSMFEHGVAPEGSPTLWIMIPILTLLGITLIRLDMGYEHHFHDEVSWSALFFLTTFIVSLQVIFGKLGYAIMRRNKYFRTFIFGDKQSVPSLALICPGVASVVFYLFFIHYGLLHMHMVDKFSVAYFMWLLPALYIHYKTVYYFFKIKKNLAL
jgi:hypothetical protein